MNSKHYAWNFNSLGKSIWNVCSWCWFDRFALKFSWQTNFSGCFLGGDVLWNIWENLNLSFSIDWLDYRNYIMEGLIEDEINFWDLKLCHAIALVIFVNFNFYSANSLWERSITAPDIFWYSVDVIEIKMSPRIFEITHNLWCIKQNLSTARKNLTVYNITFISVISM